MRQRVAAVWQGWAGHAPMARHGPGVRKPSPCAETAAWVAAASNTGAAAAEVAEEGNAGPAAGDPGAADVAEDVLPSPVVRRLWWGCCSYGGCCVHRRIA